MANLAISSVCNLSCPYCFAAAHLDGDRALERPKRFVDEATFTAWLDFLDRSGIGEVRLLGGEPTLHPRFSDLVALARARDKRLMVFTNGLMPERALACLEQLPAEACTVLVNMNEPALDGAHAHARRCDTVRRLRERAMLGYNIHRVGFRADFLLPIIEGTGCQRVIRLGIAHPRLSGDNTYIHTSQYAAVGERIVEFARSAATAGVRLELDCGFVPCMFSADGLETMKGLDTGLGWRCNPILDVDTLSRAIHCYPLSDFTWLPVTADTNAHDLRRAFEEPAKPYRQAGIFRGCSSCPRKAEGTCPGGCLAATMRRFQRAPENTIVFAAGSC